MKPYFVGHWFLWSDGELRHKQYECNDLESARARFDQCVEQSNSTKVVIRRRSGNKRNQSTAIQAWSAPI